MPIATLNHPVAASPDESDAPCTPEEIAARRAFEALYSNWLAARAIHIDPTQPDDDESADKRADARDEAERQLVAAPAPTRAAVWMKWEALELALADDYRDGSYNDARAMRAIGAIKTDLLRFGFGE
jgi:hypothetical protein